MLSIIEICDLCKEGGIISIVIVQYINLEGVNIALHCTLSDH